MQAYSAMMEVDFLPFVIFLFCRFVLSSLLCLITSYDLYLTV